MRGAHGETDLLLRHKEGVVVCLVVVGVVLAGEGALLLACGEYGEGLQVILSR